MSTLMGGRREQRSPYRAGVKEIGLAILQWYVRRFPIDKGKGRLVSALWKPLAGSHGRRQTVLRQADIHLVCDLTKHIQRRLYFWGGYEEDGCARWLRLARESTIIVDVGANVGLYSLLAAWANPQSEVYAFEPMSEMAAILRENMALNRIHNISIEPMAVGNAERRGFLRLCAGSDGSNEGMSYLVERQGDGSDRPVDVVDLDNYCQLHGIERIDLMKIDIEGGEYEALLGARRLLQAQAIGCIFLELAEWAAERSGHSTYAIKQLLVDAGYRLFRFGSSRLVPISASTDTVAENVIALANGPGWRKLGRTLLEREDSS